MWAQAGASTIEAKSPSRLREGSAPSGVLHILQPLDPAGVEAGLTGIELRRVLVRLGLTQFAAFLLLALGHEMFQSGEMPARCVRLKGGGVNVGVVWSLRRTTRSPITFLKSLFCG